jgi:hypothetical protein
MKLTHLLYCWIIGASAFLSISGPLRGQGTLTFDEPWVEGGNILYREYYEQGVWLRVVTTPPNCRIII